MASPPRKWRCNTRWSAAKSSTPRPGESTMFTKASAVEVAPPERKAVAAEVAVEAGGREGREVVEAVEAGGREVPKAVEAVDVVVPVDEHEGAQAEADGWAPEPGVVARVKPVGGWFIDGGILGWSCRRTLGASPAAVRLPTARPTICCSVPSSVAVAL